MNNTICTYYRKRAANLLLQLEKAGVSLAITDIHNVRKEIKKIRSLIKLFRFISEESSYKTAFKEYLNSLKELFEYTGRIREIQVNLINLEKHRLNSPGVRSYKNHINAEVNKLLEGFGKIKGNFNKKKFNETTLMIKKLCEAISNQRIESKSRDFIIHEIKRLNKIQKKTSGQVKYHDIRIHLKKLAAISELLFFISKDKKNKKFITALNKTESKLGNWHDHVILRDSIQSFLKSKPKNTFTELRSLVTRIDKTNKAKAKSFDSDINKALKLFKK